MSVLLSYYGDLSSVVLLQSSVSFYSRKCCLAVVCTMILSLLMSSLQSTWNNTSNTVDTSGVGKVGREAIRISISIGERSHGSCNWLNSLGLSNSLNSRSSSCESRKTSIGDGTIGVASIGMYIGVSSVGYNGNSWFFVDILLSRDLLMDILNSRNVLMDIGHSSRGFISFLRHGGSKSQGSHRQKDKE